MTITYRKPLTASALKTIAISAMFFDHLFSVFVVHESLAGSLLRITGRVAAPIMCCLVAEGCCHTSHLGRYAIRMALFAAISHLPYVLYYNLNPLRATSVMWSLLLGLLTLSAVRSRLAWPVKIIAVVLCCLAAYLADWHYVGVLWIVAFGIFRGQFWKQALAFSVIGLCLFIIPTIRAEGWAHAYQFGIFLALPLLWLYNGRRGRGGPLMKWGFYIFYPAHLILLEILRHYVGV